MLLRLLFALTLLTQQFALLPVLTARSDGIKCVMTACCVVVETTTCCGEAVSEVRCARSGGGACQCVSPADPDSNVPTPATPESGESGPALFAAARTGFALPLDREMRSLGRSAMVAPGRTHNETQALLCIWRT